MPSKNNSTSVFIGGAQKQISIDAHQMAINQSIANANGATVSNYLLCLIARASKDAFKKMDVTQLAKSVTTSEAEDLIRSAKDNPIYIVAVKITELIASPQLTSAPVGDRSKTSVLRNYLVWSNSPIGVGKIASDINQMAVMRKEPWVICADEIKRGGIIR